MKKVFITIIAMLLPLMACADDSGTCGKNLTWSYVEATKTLTISGTGDMIDYYSSVKIPWYRYKTNIQSVKIESGVKSIGACAFFDCSGLTSVTISNGVVNIGLSAFGYCRNLTSITIPKSVTMINGNSFENCDNLKSIKVENGNPKYDSSNNCNAIIETGTATLITGCKNTTIPYSVTTIGSHAFSGCIGLTSLTIPSGVTSIGNYAFDGCSGLTSIDIPTSVTTIGGYAFDGCSSLIAVTIPNSVTTIGENAFSRTAWYNNLTDGLVYAGKVLYKYKGSMPENTKIVVPDGTLGIAGGAFKDCKNLISIVIPSSVVSMGDDVVTYILPIPVAVTFSGCDNLAYVCVLNSIPPFCNPYHLINTFSSYADNVMLWVPKDCLAAYQESIGWNEFQNIRELIPGDVNLDFEVNQDDLNATVNHIMGNDQEGFYESLADLNGDDKVDVADVVKLIDILNIQEGLSMDWQANYNNQVVSSLTCTLNNDGDKTIQLTKCELYHNQSLVSSANFKTTLAPGGSKKCSFDDLASLSAKEGFSVVWHYTYNGESYTYRCDLTE